MVILPEVSKCPSSLPGESFGAESSRSCSPNHAIASTEFLRHCHDDRVHRSPRRMIQPFDSVFASALKQSRDGLVSRLDRGLSIHQAGAAYIGAQFEVPVTPFGLTEGNPAIETFVVEVGAPIVPTGENTELIDLWQPSAQKMADAVLEACDEFGIKLATPGYLTASALPLDQVSHEPHFDDDQYTPSDGVGIVAIVGNYGGTRCTAAAIEVPAVPPDAPISLPTELQNRFDRGDHPSVESEPERIVIFPQFGQLHSGPILTDLVPRQLRTLFVLRVKTASARDAAFPPKRRGRAAHRPRIR